MMTEQLITREEVTAMVADAERIYPVFLLEDFRWTLDCGRPMGTARTWVEIAPELQVQVHPRNTHYVLLFYPRAKHWLDPTWKPTVYMPFW
jgi:hypothetical protein